MPGENFELFQNINDNLITQHFHSSNVLSKINEKFYIEI